jgi:hypothetical protein
MDVTAPVSEDPVDIRRVRLDDDLHQGKDTERSRVREYSDSDETRSLDERRQRALNDAPSSLRVVDEPRKEEYDSYYEADGRRRQCSGLAQYSLTVSRVGLRRRRTRTRRRLRRRLLADRPFRRARWLHAAALDAVTASFKRGRPRPHPPPNLPIWPGFRGASPRSLRLSRCRPAGIADPRCSFLVAVFGPARCPCPWVSALVPSLAPALSLLVSTNLAGGR